MGSGIKTAAVAMVFCLPCLIPLLLAAGIGAGAISAIGAWVADGGLVLGAATAAALLVGTAGALLYVRRGSGAACEIDPTKEDLGTSPQGPHLATPKESITRGAKERVRR